MLRKSSLPLIIASVTSLIYGLIGSLVSLHRYWQYEVFYFDFGIFDKAIWSVSRFTLPIIDHYALGERIIFADHFSPTIFLLAPFFWVFPFSETLLVLQAVAVAASGFVLFLIGRSILKQPWYAMCLMIVYYLFVGLQNAVITDFHEVTVGTLFFMLTFLSFVRRDKRMFSLFFILLLGIKESVFLMGIGISVAVFFLEHTWRKTAIILGVVAVVWGVVAIKGVIPFFSEGQYLYTSEFPTNPMKIAASFVDSPIKQDTLWYTFRSFGFLPLLTPAFWVLILQDFLTRFYAPLMTLRWGLAFHYSALTAAIMGVSSVYAVHFLMKKIPQKMLTILLIGIVINAAFLYRVTLDGPFALGYNPAFYAHTKDFDFLDEAIAKIPKNVSVMSQNNLAPHLTHQQVWLMISDQEKYPAGEYYTTKRPEYILLDIHEGQNANNFFGIQDLNLLLTNLNRDPNYTLLSSSGGQLIYKRK